MEAVLQAAVIFLLLGITSTDGALQNPLYNAECFASCRCEDEWNLVCEADASFVQNVQQFNEYMFRSTANVQTRVQLITNEKHVPSFIRHLPIVRNLSLEGNSIETLQQGAFTGMRLHQLNLSGNAISTIQSGSFSDLRYLKSLDLSHNQLTKLGKDVFSEMPALEVLILDHNRLRFFPFDVSSTVPSLKVLMLNHNSLSYLVPTHLSSLTSLQILGARRNNMTAFVVDVHDEVPTLQVLDVAENPFQCSCGLVGLKRLIERKSVALMDPKLTTCTAPTSQSPIPVKEVISAIGNCSEPSVFPDFNSREILYVSDVEVGCDIDGDPNPAILWETPWGDQFADALHFAALEDVCQSCKSHRKYRGIGISTISEVSVLGQGRILKITAFRGFFNGNITCTAFNFLGNDSATRYVEVFSSVPSLMLESCMFGGFCAAGFLSMGLMIGSVKLVYLALKKRFGPKDLARSPPPVSEVEESAGSFTDDAVCKDDIDPNDDFYPPETPFTTPTDTSPSTSPKKSDSPTEEAPPGGWLPTGIFDTVEEVRWRLRYGMGRKMCAVKRNVRSMKESGSVYVHNIMESGSTAANRVKAGVVMGMETVKLHVQSIKEFCGTGDMGNQTISMVSVETNIDTNETREVVKSITLV